jgi:N-acetylglucosamine malate deacetylase 1
MEESNRQLPFRPKSYYCYMQWHEFQPSFVVDISRQFEQRMKAVLAYKSQFFDPESREPETVLSSEGFLDMVRTRLAYYGDKIGVPYGEPFHTPHVIRIDDLYAL